MREMINENIKKLLINFDKQINNLNEEIKPNNILNFQNWKNLITCFYDLMRSNFRLTNSLMNEITYLKNNITKQSSAYLNTQNLLNQRTKQLDKLNSDMEKLGISEKLGVFNKKEETIEDIKSKFQVKESNYILNIYKLEEEIKTLVKNLNENRVDSSKIGEYQKKYEKLEKESLINMNELRTDNIEKEKRIIVLYESINNLKEGLEKQKSKNDDLEFKMKDLDKTLLNKNVKIDNLNKLLKDKDQEIENLKTEIINLKNEIKAKNEFKVTEVKTKMVVPIEKSMYS
jgi:chromosome segregation ATPase